MSHQQFVRYCRLQDMPENVYQGVPYPHSYLLIWLECKRHRDPFTGVAQLPEPEKGWLEQDADLILAFEVLDAIQERREQEEEQRRKFREQTAAYFGGTMAGE